MISEKLPMPNEYTLAWSGQHEIIQQNSNRWKVAGLISLATIILLLCAASRSWLLTLIVLLTVRFSVAGAIRFLWLLAYNWSGAVIVEGFKAAGRMNTDQDLRL